MDGDLKERVILAAEYIENGDPYKDVLNNQDIMELIEWAAKELVKEGRK